ncbi:hypothetical protein BKA63DRAFT_560656 [Paraphoma chrysanthemicola]|nr:hypothetical protein BKA63DRAFT_560656 [Paraphoma chrysanthemicola]
MSLLLSTIIHFASNYHDTMTNVPADDPTATRLPFDKSLSQLLSTLAMTQPTSEALAFFVDSMVTHFDARISRIEGGPKMCIRSDPINVDAEFEAQLDKSVPLLERGDLIKEQRLQQLDRAMEDLQAKMDANKRCLLGLELQHETFKEEYVHHEDLLHREVGDIRVKTRTTHQLAHGGISDIQQMLRAELVSLKQKLDDKSSRLHKQQTDLSHTNGLLQAQNARQEGTMGAVTSRMRELMDTSDVLNGRAEEQEKVVKALEEQGKRMTTMERRLANLEASMDAAATTVVVRPAKKARTNPEV